VKRRLQLGDDWAWSLEENLRFLKHFWQRVAEQHPFDPDEPDPNQGGYARFILTYVAEVERRLARRPSRQNTRLIARDCLTLGEVHQDARTTFNLGPLIDEGQRFHQMMRERRQTRAATFEEVAERCRAVARELRNATPYDRSVHHTVWLSKRVSKTLAADKHNPLELPAETIRRSYLRGHIK
jgi:hypothetical protein